MKRSEGSTDWVPLWVLHVSLILLYFLFLIFLLSLISFSSLPALLSLSRSSPCATEREREVRVASARRGQRPTSVARQGAARGGLARRRLPGAAAWMGRLAVGGGKDGGVSDMP